MFTAPRTRRLARACARWTLVALSLCATLALGLFSKFYEGPAGAWVRQDLNGVFYTMAWAFGLALLLPRLRARTLGWAAFTISCAIECTQLWHPHFLEVLRATHLGRLALGSTFALGDLPYYAVGGLVAVGWLLVLPLGRVQVVGARGQLRPRGVPESLELPALERFE